MPSFLFWNIAKNASAFSHVSQICRTHSIDVLFLAECPAEVGGLITLLNQEGKNVYRIADRGDTKVRGITRLAESDFFPHRTNVNGDITFWNLVSHDPEIVLVQIAVLHLPAKSGGITSEDQVENSCRVVAEITDYEEQECCHHTILIGDFNMNPYEPAMVQTSGFHGMMTKMLASKTRTWKKEEYRRFYNPMWGFFGDRTAGPAGTYYWKSGVSSNHHWHLLDQVLLRPSLMNRLTDLAILDDDGLNSLVDSNGIPTRECISDHLPLLCVLDI